MNTVTVPNTIATAASTGADINGKAVQVMTHQLPATFCVSKPFSQGTHFFSLGNVPDAPSQECQKEEGKIPSSSISQFHPNE
jgi:hypothetical protein